MTFIRFCCRPCVFHSYSSFQASSASYSCLSRQPADKIRWLRFPYGENTLCRIVDGHHCGGEDEKPQQILIDLIQTEKRPFKDMDHANERFETDISLSLSFLREETPFRQPTGILDAPVHTGARHSSPRKGFVFPYHPEESLPPVMTMDTSLPKHKLYTNCFYLTILLRGDVLRRKKRKSRISFQDSCLIPPPADSQYSLGADDGA